MGANIALAWLPAFNVTEDRLQDLRDLVKQTPPTTLFDVQTREAVTYLLSAAGADSLEEMTEVLLGTIEQLDGLDQYRDVAAVTLGRSPLTYWMSGGMSWGDSPTESFDTLQTIGRSPLIRDLLQAWACADMADAQEQNAAEQRYRDKAVELYEVGSDDDIEVDRGGVVSRGGDPGCWVAAWVWVPDDAIEGENDSADE